MKPILHAWPFVLALALLCMLSCSALDETRHEAGFPDAGLADSGNDGGSDTDSDGDVDTDGDGDTDTDSDTDTDADTDSDAGVDNCADGGGMIVCDSDQDCGGAGSGCICPKLMGDEEITSYCYQSCDEVSSCPGSDQTCVKLNDGSDRGVCLHAAYWSISWWGKYQPVDVMIDPNACYSSLNEIFEIGSVSCHFGISITAELNDPESGHLVSIVFFDVSTPSWWWVMRVDIPYDQFEVGTFDLSDCPDGGLCGGMLVEEHLQGSYADQIFIRAINIIDPESNFENWIQLLDATKWPCHECHGTFKLFFAEYSAEIAVE